jgi:hypothetical protein
MSLLAVDPGLRGCGCALFVATSVKLHSADLVWAGYVGTLLRSDSLLSARWKDLAELVARTGGSQVFELAIELPQVYDRSKSKGDPNDLIALAGLVGTIVGRLGVDDTTVYLPRAWKGQVPKPENTKQPYIIAERCKKRLSKDELLKVNLPGNVKLQWDVWDAIGLGLFHVGRMG